MLKGAKNINGGAKLPGPIYCISNQFFVGGASPPLPLVAALHLPQYKKALASSQLNWLALNYGMKYLTKLNVAK